MCQLSSLCARIGSRIGGTSVHVQHSNRNNLSYLFAMMFLSLTLRSRIANGIHKQWVEICVRPPRRRRHHEFYIFPLRIMPHFTPYVRRGTRQFSLPFSLPHSLWTNISYRAPMLLLRRNDREGFLVYIWTINDLWKIPPCTANHRTDCPCILVVGEVFGGCTPERCALNASTFFCFFFSQMVF